MRDILGKNVKKIKNLKLESLDKDRVIEELTNKMIEKDVIENKLRKEINEKKIVDDKKGKKGFIETIVEQEQEEMLKKVDKYKKEISGYRKEVERLKDLAADSKVIEEKLKRVILKKDELVMKASKIEGIEEKELKVVRKLGEGSFGEVFKASYKGETIAIKKMKNHPTSIIELTVLLKTSNSPNLLNTKLVGVRWPSQKNSEIIVGLELCDCDLRGILPLNHTKFKLITDIIVGSCQAVAQLAN